MLNHEQQRFGSAGAASAAELRRAGLYAGRGVSLGMDGRGKALRNPGDGSVAVFGGSGSGKSAALFQGNLQDNHVGNTLIFDPRGELCAVNQLADSLHGYEAYTLNPHGVPGVAQHRCNVLDHITLESPRIIANAQKAALDLIPSPAGGDKSKWWIEDAQDWLAQLVLHDTEHHGTANIGRVFDALQAIQGDLDRWCDHLEAMVASRFASVRRFAGQIMALQKGGRDGFTAPLSTLQTAFRFMQDPNVAGALSGDDFSLQGLLDPARKMRAYVVWPIEYIPIQAPAIRLLIGSVIQHKLAQPGSAKVSLLIDECGQLGHFPSVRELYTFGRGAGLVNNICAWQELSQITRAFGHDGANEIIGSAQFRVFKGVRTMDTAQLVSSMCGTMTLAYDAEMQQSDARRLKQQAAHALMTGGDFLQAAANLRHYTGAETHRTKQARPLLTPDEVLNLPSSQMVAFASGLLEGPILGHWRLYFERPELAGRYLPNPYHDPDHVRIKTHLGRKKTAPAVRASVPASLAHLPQYQDGSWTYIKGYRPKV